MYNREVYRNPLIPMIKEAASSENNRMETGLPEFYRFLGLFFR